MREDEKEHIETMNACQIDGVTLLDGVTLATRKANTTTP